MALRPEDSRPPAAVRRAEPPATAAARVAIGLAAVLFAGAAPAAGSGIYKWTDSEGHVHYGDRPTGEDASEIEIDRPGAAGTGEERRREKRERLLRAFEQDRADRRAEADARRQETERRQKLTRQCARARDRLRTMRDANRLYDYDTSGQRVYLSDAERAERVAELRRQIDVHCK